MFYVRCQRTPHTVGNISKLFEFGCVDRLLWPSVLACTAMPNPCDHVKLTSHRTFVGDRSQLLLDVGHAGSDAVGNLVEFFGYT